MIKSSTLEKTVTGKFVLVDTNIIIYLTDSIPPYEKLSRQLFEMIEKGEVSAVLSVISVAEVMQGPLKKGSIEKAHEVKNYLMNFPNVHCQDITGDVLDNVGKNSAIEWSQLRVMDSLILASGLVNSVNLIISNDIHFKKALAGDIILAFD
ncbi:MAG: type II toxin-antitoxin system VapC family toxin [Desulfobacterales bacterium]